MGLKASLGYFGKNGGTGDVPTVKRPSEGSASQTVGSTSVKLPNVKYPGNDPMKSPGEGFQWRGRGDIASNRGSWVNEKTGETWRHNLYHAPPIGPHWDYTDPLDNEYRVYEGDRVELKRLMSMEGE